MGEFFHIEEQCRWHRYLNWTYSIPKIQYSRVKSHSPVFVRISAYFGVFDTCVQVVVIVAIGDALIDGHCVSLECRSAQCTLGSISIDLLEMYIVFHCETCV